jgi:TolB-like protein/DNA-binding winged helix-turn-helix (wHTH) protein
MNPEIEPKVGPTALGEAVRSGAKTLEFPTFAVDLDRGELRVRGTVVALRPKSFELLAYIARYPGELIPKERLMHAIWPNVIVTDDSLVQCIGEIRSALGDRRQELIRTVPRRGYRLDASLLPQMQLPARSTSQPSSAGLRLPGWPGAALLLAIGVALAAAMHVHRPSYAPGTIDVAVASRRAIAVMPLRDMSVDKTEVLAESVTEGLVNDISRVPDTLVIAQGSSSRFSTDIDVREVARALDVAFVLSGSVRRAGETVTVLVQLRSGKDASVVWTERFDYPSLAEWESQRDVTSRIANALAVQLDQSVASRFAYPSESPDVVEATLQAWHILRHARAASDLVRARVIFDRARAIDPDSVSALTGWATTHLVEVLQRWSANPGPQVAEAAQAVEHALRVQPNNPRTVFAHSLVLYAQGRIDEAGQATERALMLRPNEPRALQRLGFLRLQQGRPEDVAAPVLLAMRLNPLDPEQVGWGHFILGMADFHLHRDDAAYSHMRQATVLAPQNGFAWQWMASMNALNGKLDEARTHLSAFNERIPGRTVGNLKVSEPSTNATFWRERARFYDGLRLAGLPE